MSTIRPVDAAATASMFLPAMIRAPRPSLPPGLPGPTRRGAKRSEAKYALAPSRGIRSFGPRARPAWPGEAGCRQASGDEMFAPRPCRDPVIGALHRIVDLD